MRAGVRACNACVHACMCMLWIRGTFPTGGSGGRGESEEVHMLPAQSCYQRWLAGWLAGWLVGMLPAVVSRVVSGHVTLMIGRVAGTVTSHATTGLGMPQ